MTENTFNRLARMFMDKGMSYDVALAELQAQNLSIVCGKEVRTSPAHQAALLTAVNTGKRAFLGGIRVDMPSQVPLLIPWSKAENLNSVVSELLNGVAVPAETAIDAQLIIGNGTSSSENSVRLYCDGWRGVLAPANAEVEFVPGPEFALGGIAAGALGVAQVFLKAAGLESRAGDKVVGVSLWRPDLLWSEENAIGPPLESLPKAYWLLGLGHLGQAYLWNIGLLPYEQPEFVTLLLQDFDRVAEANWSAGLLTEENCISELKTRVCAKWAHDRGFNTTITERRFDSHTIRTGEEPYLALCGFDNAKARLTLEQSGFDLVIEAALGGKAHSFDRFVTHTFPNASKKPEQIWGGFEEKIVQPTPEFIRAAHAVADCGILALTLANKAISASFVGAFTGALVVSESLRACHGGVRCEVAAGHLRSLASGTVAIHPCGFYSDELARNGVVNANSHQLIHST